MTFTTLSVVYAQTNALDIAQSQSRASNDFTNEQLTASNANRYAELQDQVGSTIQSQGRIVDQSQLKVDATTTQLDAATTSYTSVNVRFRH